MKKIIKGEEAKQLPKYSFKELVFESPQVEWVHCQANNFEIFGIKQPDDKFEFFDVTRRKAPTLGGKVVFLNEPRINTRIKGVN